MKIPQVNQIPIKFWMGRFASIICLLTINHDRLRMSVIEMSDWLSRYLSFSSGTIMRTFCSMNQLWFALIWIVPSRNIFVLNLEFVVISYQNYISTVSWSKCKKAFTGRSPINILIPWQSHSHKAKMWANTAKRRNSGQI